MVITAQDIMSEHVVTIHEEMLMSQAAHLMLRDRVSAFPVVRGENELVGIITMTDLFTVIDLAVSQHGHDLKEYLANFKNVRVAEVMSKEIFSIAPETKLTHIIRLLRERHIHTFPVMANGKVIGIVSRHDILNAVFSFF
jgi:CBS domain-containing protein